MRSFMFYIFGSLLRKEDLLDYTYCLFVPSCINNRGANFIGIQFQHYASLFAIVQEQ
jgi:hypothetical protein